MHFLLNLIWDFKIENDNFSRTNTLLHDSLKKIKIKGEGRPPPVPQFEGLVLLLILNKYYFQL